MTYWCANCERTILSYRVRNRVRKGSRWSTATLQIRTFGRRSGTFWWSSSPGPNLANCLDHKKALKLAACSFNELYALVKPVHGNALQDLRWGNLQECSAMQTLRIRWQLVEKWLAVKLWLLNYKLFSFENGLKEFSERLLGTHSGDRATQALLRNQTDLADLINRWTECSK